MDIQILLWLQNLRESMGPLVETFFVAISEVPVSAAIVLIPCIVYWCLDKRGGLFMLLNFCGGMMVAGLVKNSVCSYRPWVREPAITPAPAAMPGAEGYSFPSGHTMNAVTVFGSLIYRYHKRSKALTVFCSLLIILVAFSRCLLGCHTPQDVLVALVLGTGVLIASDRLLNWLQKEEERDVLFLVAGLVMTLLYIIFVAFKPYPMDYVGGTLLMDPATAIATEIRTAGFVSGLIIGCFCEHRFIRFRTNATMKVRLLRIVLGCVIMVVFGKVIPGALKTVLPVYALYYLKGFLPMIAATLVVPACFLILKDRDDHAAHV